MVTIKDLKTIKKDDGEEFYCLIVEGGIQPVKSQKTGRMYFTTRTATVPTTFDLKTCKKVIGTSFEGEVRKVACDPYDYTIEDTGETIELKHRWEFIDDTLDVLEEHVVETAKIK